MKRIFSKLLAASAAGIFIAAGIAPGTSWAQDQQRMRIHSMDRDHVYGSGLMTDAERQAHQNKMQNARTWQERERIREEHRQEMIERARKQGVKLGNPSMHRPMMRGGMKGGQGGRP